MFPISESLEYDEAYTHTLFGLYTIFTGPLIVVVDLSVQPHLFGTSRTISPLPIRQKMYQLVYSPPIFQHREIVDHRFRERTFP
jgi:hypothetical protein